MTDTSETMREQAVERALLREVLERGLIYWEPNTSRGHAAKADMMLRIEAALASPPVAPDRTAYLHILHMEHEQENRRLTFTDANPFGLPGKDYSAEYPVTSHPLFLAPDRTSQPAEHAVERAAWKTDDCRAAGDWSEDQAEQLAFELSWELEEASLSADDYVTVNQAKLLTIAKRVLERLATLQPAQASEPDARRTIETLRRALAWHGDPARMATTREEWQQEIDAAIEWVKANPEPGRPSFSSFTAQASDTAPVGFVMVPREIVDAFFAIFDPAAYVEHDSPDSKYVDFALALGEAAAPSTDVSDTSNGEGGK